MSESASEFVAEFQYKTNENHVRERAKKQTNVSGMLILAHSSIRFILLVVGWDILVEPPGKFSQCFFMHEAVLFGLFFFYFVCLDQSGS